MQVGRPTLLNSNRTTSNLTAPFNQGVPPGGMPVKNSSGLPPGSVNGPMGSVYGNIINGTQIHSSHQVSNKFIQVYNFRID